MPTIPLKYKRDAPIIEAAERAAEEEVQAALTLGLVTESYPGFSNPSSVTQTEDAWYEACFEATREELRAAAEALVAEYHQTPTRRKRHRQHRADLRNAYIRIDARLGRALGITTIWT